MKRERTFTDFWFLASIYTSITGIIVVIFAVIMGFIIGELWDVPLAIGMLAAMLPFFIFEFIFSAGLLNQSEFQADIPIWGKAFFYLLGFPFINLWMISGANALFHFLPDFHGAHVQGANLEVLRLMQKESSTELWTLMGIVYALMVGGGLLVRWLRAYLRKKNRMTIA